VFGKLNRLLAAGIGAGVLLLVLVVPSTALADCKGRPSAENVYSECLPSGGGGNAKGGTPSGGGQAGSTPAAHISPRTAKALKQAGKDRRFLAGLIRNTGPRPLAGGGSAGATRAPSALGSAFDLGSGPTALLIALAGTAVFLLAAGGIRGWRRSRRV
jgi:hypothetical protein